MSDKTDTPRSDANEKLFYSSINGLPDPSRNYVPIDFARTLERELNQLRQDVRPLVRYLQEFADCCDGAPDASPKDKEACFADDVLRTFLAKHPEMK